MTDYIAYSNFLGIAPGVIFARGEAPDSPEGLHMVGTGRMLKWVAVKGYCEDWAMYCGWADENDWISVSRSGDKVCDWDNITNVLDVDSKVKQAYRY